MRLSWKNSVRRKKMKIKEYGLICLWLAEHCGTDLEVVGSFAYRFKDMVDDVSEEGLILNEN